MENWEKFEFDSANWLNSSFKTSNLNFRVTGGSNSNESDIKVFRNNLYLESVEAKLVPSQSGQVVILPIDGEFIISSKSVYKNNPYSNIIVKHMNDNFSKYNKVSTSGIPLSCDESILFSWIKHHYIEQKNSNYIVAGTLDDYRVFIPVQQINNYFNVKCSYRKKKSGTSELRKKNGNIFASAIGTHLSSIGINLIKVYWMRILKNNKYFIELDSKVNKKNLYLEFDDFTTFLSYKGSSCGIHTYEVKQTSNTNNPNIVFSIALSKALPNNFGFEEFKKHITKI